MDPITDTLWDVVICGTGLPQSLLALSLSRSGKKVLHVDPNDYYGGAEAAFSLQEAETWVAGIHARSQVTADAAAAGQDAGASTIFSAAVISKPSPPAQGTKEGEEGGQTTSGLSFSRAYSIALAPQIIHTKSELLRQLVSSRAYRQVEFLAVGSFFIFKQPEAEATEDQDAQQRRGLQPSLVRIPSTREDVFLTTAISTRGKRALMKFLKFITDYDALPQADTWAPYKDKPLADFLQSEFRLDADLQAYVTTLTLSLESSSSGDNGGGPTTARGLAAIHRHLSSFGLFGPGFAAVYPKWGGLSEIAQVACRAGAVGGGVYMLDTRILAVRTSESSDAEARVELDLSSGMTVRSKLLVRGDGHNAADGAAESTQQIQRISRLVAVVDSPLLFLFQAVMDGAPKPAVAVIAFPPGSVNASSPQNPVYAFAHSSDTGECPVGQSILYLTTLSTSGAKTLLEQTLESFLAAVGAREDNEKSTPRSLYQLYYEHEQSETSSWSSTGPVLDLPGLSPGLSFDDTDLDPVQQAWKTIVGEAPGEEEEAEYMVFADRQGAGEDEGDSYDAYET